MYIHTYIHTYTYIRGGGACLHNEVEVVGGLVEVQEPHDILVLHLQVTSFIQYGLGFMVQGLGLRDENLGLRVENLGFRIEGLGLRV